MVSQLVMERTVRVGATPVRAGSRAGQAPGREHEWRAVVVVVAGVLAVLLAGTWTFAQGWGRGPVAGPDQIAVDGGIAHVDGAISAARPQHAMPGMGTDDDPVADGDRRVSIDVTLLAGTGEMSYSADRFALEVGGEQAKHLTHRDILPGTELPPGTRLSGTLVFDVPADATAARLVYRGEGAVDVVLPAEQGQSSTATHGGATGGHAAGGHGTGGSADSTGTPAEG